MRRVFRLPWRTRGQIRADVDDELRFHLDMRVEELVRLGMSGERARAEALRQFGDLDDARQYITAVDRDTEAAQRRIELMSDFRQDLVYALRKLRSTPAFTLAAVMTLALGIGANTAIFSVVNGVLLRPLPFPQSNRVMGFRFFEGGGGDAGTPLDLSDYRSRSRSFQQLAMFEGRTMNLVRAGADPQQLTAARVSANWFDLVRVPPALGRGFVAGEDAEGAGPVVILSDGVWRRVFGAESSVVGRSIQLNGDDYTVVGVMPRHSGYLAPDLWTPLVFTANDLTENRRGARWLSMIGRLRDGVTVDAAQAEIARVSAQLSQEYSKYYEKRTVRPVPLQQLVVGELRTPLLVIMGAVAFVLLIACANVANLFLVRATTRESELAIRTALGAGRSRLVRQLVTEAIVLSALGAAAGLALARWGMHALLGLAPDDLPRVASATMDGRALTVTAGVALLTGILFGVLPAVQSRTADLASALRAGARGARTRQNANRTSRAVVVAEVALAVTLTTSAGLMLRSFQHLLAVDPGFRSDGVLTFRVSLPDRTYEGLDTRRNFVRALQERLRAIPGVRAAAASNALPLDGSDLTLSFAVRGRAPVPEPQQPSAQIVVTTPDYFNALGMHVVRGRGFREDDRETSPQVVVLSREFVTRHFPNEDPIGRHVDIGWMVDGVRRGGEVVGVVDDVKQRGLDQAAPVILYLPFAQAPVPNLRVTVRTSVAPASVTSAVRTAVRETDPSLPVYAVRTLEDYVGMSIAPQRFYSTLVGLFAVVALTLAAVGLYGLVTYTVTQRTHEMGIRVALGASAERVVTMIVRQGLALCATGVAIGVVAALVATRILRSLLFGVSASDPLTFVSAAILLMLVAALASYLPARRASRVDPLIAMRGE